jgi:23S rRNA pseudouridine2605 synthase
MLVMNTRNTGRGKSRSQVKAKSNSTSKKEFAPKKKFSASADSKKSVDSKDRDPKKDIKKEFKKTTTGEGGKAPATVKAKGRFSDFKARVKKGDPMPKFDTDEIRLNKYLSNAGICSRREADVLIQTGVVSVNNEIILELGYKVKPDDIVKYDGATINAEVKRYILLNKPKDFITTMDDPLGRKTVMSLVRKACKERVYPVGRLDRETTGLLLFTNDGDMAKKLTHPAHKSVKIYHAELNKPVKKEDLLKLIDGIDLEDGKASFDKAEYVKDRSNEIGVELHSGKNRIVRRMFESLGYVVVKLDRVKFAGLTKKDLPRGMYRHLKDREVDFLKMS